MKQKAHEKNTEQLNREPQQPEREEFSLEEIMREFGGWSRPAELDEAPEAPEAPEEPETPEAPEEPAAPEETETEPDGMASRVNLNTADAAALESLPGIGPALAQRIIDYRMANGPFQTTAEIQDVRGIGAGIYAEIKDSITVE